MDLEDKISIKIEMGTLATLIAGLYCTSAVLDPIAIPTSLYIELAEKLVPLLGKWDYSKISLEEWIEKCLIIAPYELFTSDEIEEFKKNELYIERMNGNALLIATARMVK